MGVWNKPDAYEVGVETLFLGNTNSLSVITFTTDDLCGLYLEEGEEYVLGLNYVSPASGKLILGSCGLARMWNNDDEEMDELDAGCGACHPICDEDQARRDVGSMVFARVLMSFCVDGFVKY